MDQPDTPGTEVLGTDKVAPVQADTVPDYVYHDPDEDTVEGEVPDATDDGIEQSEPEAPEPAEDAVEDAEEPKGDDAQPEEEQEPDLLTLSDGTKATLEELEKDRLRQADYSRKTQALSNERREVEQNARQLQGITDSLIDQISKLVPPEPNPNLAQSDPAEYQRQDARYRAAMRVVEGMMATASQASTVTEGIDHSTRARVAERENAALAEMFPETRNRDAKREAFFDRVTGAAEKLGFTKREMAGATDHRLFALAHWAEKGMQAAEDRVKAKAKVEKAPQAPARKPGQPAGRPNRNREAMSKLSKTGSIHDALKVEFD